MSHLGVGLASSYVAVKIICMTTEFVFLRVRDAVSGASCSAVRICIFQVARRCSERC